MRAFVALPLPDRVLAALERLQDGLAAGRRVPQDNLHLTLAFLDDQPETVLSALHQELERLQAPVLSLAFRGLETFGGKTPRVLAAATAPDPDLARLRSQVREAARSAGIALPRERFRPHVTLARFPRRVEAAELAKAGRFLEAAGGFALEGVEVDRFALFQSVLDQRGARYHVLAEYPLRAPAA
ncbi:RNA 2',3'-cyclic phosphodiesterase [Roseobacteraceae bacterium NS-SX3]